VVSRGSAAVAGLGGLFGAGTGLADALFIAGGRTLGMMAGAVFGDWITGPDVVFNAPKPPEEITSWGDGEHSLERIWERGLTPDDINDAFKNPTEPPIFQNYNDRWRYVGSTATIVLEQDGTLVTAWRSY
jgi:hypothetical protein